MNQSSLYLEIKSSISFADTKLGIRIAILGIEISAVATILNHFNVKMPVYLTIMGFLTLQIIVASIGIFPKTNKAKVKCNKNNKIINNYYFGYISSFKKVDEYKIHSQEYFKNYSWELAEQIYENAKILNRKYKYFAYSFFIYMIFKLFTKLKKETK